MQEMQYPNLEAFGELFQAATEKELETKMDVRRNYHEGRGATFIKRVRIGRNDPCPCNSGKKFKHCCMPNQSVY